jgi:hypothetical protein
MHRLAARIGLLLSFLLIAAVPAPAESLDAPPEDAFTIAVIPDTQRYLGPESGREGNSGPARNPAFDSRTTWLAENLVDQRIVFVSHMGDITDRNNTHQWGLARENMDRLHGKVPYGISVGNHDFVVRDAGDSSRFQEYFGADRYVDFRWYGGTYGGLPGHQPEVSGNNANSFQLYAAGGLNVIHLHLECNAPDNVLAWADETLAAHRDRMAIITTHMYLGGIKKKGADIPQGRMQWKKVHGDRGNTPQQLWDKCFSKHPNLFLILCGDQSASITHHQTSTGEHGNPVHEILTDYPRDADESDWVRLLRFLPDEEKIEVKTYSPAQNKLCEGMRHVPDWEDHQFDLDISRAIADHLEQRGAVAAP